MPKQGYLHFQSGRESVPAFFAAPTRATASVVVFHEIWGLGPHVKEVCKRISKLGFTVMAPDLYWREKEMLVREKIQAAMRGVWDLSLAERRDVNKVRDTLTKKGLSREIFEVVTTLYDQNFRDQMLDDAVACVTYAHRRTPKVATVGFSMGGGLSAQVAARFSKLTSCVVFYGEPPEAQQVDKIRAPMLVIQAEHDDIANSKIPGFVNSVLASGKDLTLKVYPGTTHGFFNDTNEKLYNKAAADDAWELTKWFLLKTLEQ